MFFLLSMVWLRVGFCIPFLALPYFRRLEAFRFFKYCSSSVILGLPSFVLYLNRLEVSYIYYTPDLWGLPVDFIFALFEFSGFISLIFSAIACSDVSRTYWVISLDLTRWYNCLLISPSACLPNLNTIFSLNSQSCCFRV